MFKPLVVCVCNAYLETFANNCTLGDNVLFLEKMLLSNGMPETFSLFRLIHVSPVPSI